MVKRTKAYTNLEDVRLTIRNKPSGLKSDWYRTVVSNPSTPRHQVSAKHARSSSLSVSTSSSLPPSSIPPSSIPPSPLLESDRALSLIAVSPPSNISQQQFSPPFYGDLVPLIDKKSVGYQEHAGTDAVCIFYRYCTHSKTLLAI